MKKSIKKAALLLATCASSLWADFGIHPQCELHSKYQKFAFGLKDVLIYLRIEPTAHLPNDWELYLRLDLPYIWLWGTKKEEVSIGDDGLIVPPHTEGAKPMMRKTPFQEKGFADFLTRAFFVTPPLNQAKTITFGFGSEFTFPTAQDVDLGTGKYTARPLVGAKWDLPNLGNGSSWAAGLLKYQFSYAGSKKRIPFQILFIQPVFIYTFLNDWVLATTPEIQYNVREKTWFVPFFLSLSKGWGTHLSCDLTYQKGIVTDFPVFQDEVEFVLRYAF